MNMPRRRRLLWAMLLGGSALVIGTGGFDRAWDRAAERIEAGLERYEDGDRAERAVDHPDPADKRGRRQ